MSLKSTSMSEDVIGDLNLCSFMIIYLQVHENILHLIVCIHYRLVYAPVHESIVFTAPYLRIYAQVHENILRILEASPADRGTYVCEAENAYGQANASAYIEIEGLTLFLAHPVLLMLFLVYLF